MSIEFTENLCLMFAEGIADLLSEHPKFKDVMGSLSEDEFSALLESITQDIQESYRVTNYANDV